MYQFDLTTIGGFLASLWALIQGVLSLDPQAYNAALTQEGGGRLSLAVLFVAGVSITIGQSVVLFANRLPRRRFIVSLVLSSLLLLVGVLFWAASVWVLATYVFGAERSLRLVMIVVSLSYAPMLYGVFVLLPYLGNILYIFLRIWILIALVGAVTAIFPLAIWQALICSLLGWLMLEMATRLPVVSAVENWLWRKTTGTREILPTEDVVERFVSELRAASRPLPGNTSEQEEQT
ncbi:MAG: hypothetical protein IPF56_07010 [Chloroflexi bacterium]|nr:hypothetical protein [Chloroflexota bacterium]MBK6708977.1 hypothetical protein [Chloroflexota bacterium]MBK8934413.1 hypothetical protein [Chloroflexota bacterium]MBP7590834.1 hypothetical protein [Chloroflexota bacterium]